MAEPVTTHSVRNTPECPHLLPGILRPRRLHAGGTDLRGRQVPNAPPLFGVCEESATPGSLLSHQQTRHPKRRSDRPSRYYVRHRRVPRGHSDPSGTACVPLPSTRCLACRALHAPGRFEPPPARGLRVRIRPPPPSRDSFCRRNRSKKELTNPRPCVSHGHNGQRRNNEPLARPGGPADVFENGCWPAAFWGTATSIFPARANHQTIHC
jgi:hypothetical protein